MKFTVEIEHLGELRGLVVTLDRHRVGACILLVAILLVIGLAGAVWYALH